MDVIQLIILLYDGNVDKKFQPSILTSSKEICIFPRIMCNSQTTHEILIKTRTVFMKN